MRNIPLLCKERLCVGQCFNFSGYLMLVKQGAEHSALEHFVKCFDQFCISCFLMLIKLSAEHSAIM